MIFTAFGGQMLFENRRLSDSQKMWSLRVLCVSVVNIAL